MVEHRQLISEYRDSLLECSHVIGVGYGQKEKKGQKLEEEAIVVLVDKKVSQDKLNKEDIVPNKLGSYKTDVIETGKLELQNLRKSKMRPAQPGVSIGHFGISAGTMGAVVKDRRTGEKLILSNNHVLANISNGRDGRASKGDPILQPAKYDNGLQSEDIIGYLERFVPLKAEFGEQLCPLLKGFEFLVNNIIKKFKADYQFKIQKRKPKNDVDCAVASPRKEKKVQKEILEIGEVKETDDPVLEETVKKSGRSTGLTKGKIRVIDTTVEVKMTEDKSAVFERQFITDPMSTPGDSGSLVVNSKNRAVGLLFAGSGQASVCNDINLVFSALGIEF